MPSIAELAASAIGRLYSGMTISMSWSMPASTAWFSEFAPSSP